MKVWIVEQGCYGDRAIVGVFDTPERAMAAFPGRYTRNLWNQEHFSEPPYREDYTNDQGWDAAIMIREAEFITTGPESPPDAITIQRYVSDREWAYDDATKEQADALMAPTAFL